MGIDKTLSFKPIPQDELEKLKKLSIDFLTNYSKWWFNALRIQNWGASRPGYEDFGDYTVQQITMALDELQKKKKILSKDGNKSLVYKIKRKPKGK